VDSADPTFCAAYRDSVSPILRRCANRTGVSLDASVHPDVRDV